MLLLLSKFHALELVMLGTAVKVHTSMGIMYRVDLCTRDPEWLVRISLLRGMHFDMI